MPDKFCQGKFCRRRFAVFQTPGKVVLTALGHHYGVTGNFFTAYILRHTVEQFFSDPGEFAQIIGENFAVDRFGQSIFRDIQPLLPGFRCAGYAQMTAEKSADGIRAVFCEAQCALLSVFRE